MNFIEAVKAIKQGDCVKRKGQLFVAYWDNTHGMISRNREDCRKRFKEARFKIDDCLADDWIIVRKITGYKIKQVIYDECSYCGMKTKRLSEIDECGHFNEVCDNCGEPGDD